MTEKLEEKNADFDSPLDRLVMPAVGSKWVLKRTKQNLVEVTYSDAGYVQFDGKHLKKGTSGKGLDSFHKYYEKA